jgi:hypothetical protein
MIIYAEDLGEPVTAADLNALADGLVERAASNMTIYGEARQAQRVGS